jgi:hypothetical protein
MYWSTTEHCKVENGRQSCWKEDHSAWAGCGCYKGERMGRTQRLGLCSEVRDCARAGCGSHLSLRGGLLVSVAVLRWRSGQPHLTAGYCWSTCSHMLGEFFGKARKPVAGRARLIAETVANGGGVPASVKAIAWALKGCSCLPADVSPSCPPACTFIYFITIL